MPTVTLTPAEYWQLRSLQERSAHARTLVQMHEQVARTYWATLAQTYPELATGEAWTCDDATLALTAADTPGKES